MVHARQRSKFSFSLLGLGFSRLLLGSLLLLLRQPNLAGAEGASGPVLLNQKSHVGSYAPADQALWIKLRLPGLPLVQLAFQPASERRERIRSVQAGKAKMSAEWTRITRVHHRAQIRSGRKLSAIGAELVSGRSGSRRLFLSVSEEKQRSSGQRSLSFDLVVSCAQSGGACRIESARRYPARGRSGLRCGNSGSDKPRAAPGSSFEPPAEMRSVSSALHFSVAVLADSRFSSLYGGDTVDVISTAFQEVHDIYSSQLGVELELELISIAADSADDPMQADRASSVALLADFNDYAHGAGSSAADSNLLLTARRGYLDAIGLAYTGSTCAFPDFNSAWAEYASGYRVFVQTVAHELGHTLNASHDTTDPRGLMSISAKVNLRHPYFSTFSIAEVETFIGNSGSCLSDHTASPVPTPGSVTIPLPAEKARNVALTIKGRRVGRGGVVGGVLKLTVAGSPQGRVIELRKFPSLRLIKTTQTDSRGKYAFSVASRSKYYTVDRLARLATPLVTW